MSQNTTVTAKVVSASTFATLCDLNESVHHAVKIAMTDVGQKLTFSDDFSKCGKEDYKNIHQALRTLISAKRQAMWEEEVAEIRAGIQGITSTYMNAKREEKAEYDSIPAQHRKFLAPFPTSLSVPVSDFTALFPKGTTIEQMVARCKELSHTVVKLESGYVIKVAFEPASDTTAKAA
jgi:hypothetical protein